MARSASFFHWGSRDASSRTSAAPGGSAFRTVTLTLTLVALLGPRALAREPAAKSRILSTLPFQSVTNQSPAETPASPPTGASEQPIPLPQIADRAEELDHLLRDIDSQLLSKAELEEATRTAEAQAEAIRQHALQTEDLLAGTPSPLELEEEQRYWRSLSQDYAAQRKAFTERAAKLEEQIHTLEIQQPVWVATWIQNKKTSEIGAVVGRIKQQLDNILAVKSRAQEQLNVVLTLQNQISQQDQQISDLSQRVRETRERERSRLLEPDSRPLWEIGELRQMEQTRTLALFHSFDRSLTTAAEFLRANKLSTSVLILIYLFALFAAFKLRNYVARGLQPEAPAEALQVLNRPFSVALVVALIGRGEYTASAPMGIAFFFYLLYLLPVLRILIPLIEPRLRPLLYILAACYGLVGAYWLVQLPPLVRRGIHVLFLLAALASLGWLLRSLRIRPPLTPDRTLRALTIGIRANLILLTVSLTANIIGFVSLAQVISITAMVGSFVAVALYCAARVFKLILTIVLHTNWMRAVLEARVDTIELWSGRILVVGMSLLWLRAMLLLLTVYDTAVGAVSAVLRYPIGSQTLYFTLGGTCGVVAIVLGGYALARIIIFALKRIVLPKLPLQRGVPFAVSTITYYVLLLLIALAALSASGVELNKFTVLTGALGVGLGFGLQNIVNNFVSGLILLFERPIHIGDTVDVGGLVGIVRRIGARSSTVVTFQGAEVIVPNSNLLSNQVINWTLSSQWRRVDVPVRVAYGTDPERVIKLLVAVAEAYPGVLLARPPAAFFMGFGEHALNFELRFWSAEQDTWFQLQSDVAVAVAKALGEAGIEIPFPQRDLHIRSVAATAAESLATNAVRTKRPAEAAERSARA